MSAAGTGPVPSRCPRVHGLVYVHQQGLTAPGGNRRRPVSALKTGLLYTEPPTCPFLRESGQATNR